ncbi:MAG: DUF4434 domain-containing protein [Bacteroidales bacterium]|nr:DUF4434 domain-containing protein [Bacteroidales bacterium]
MKYILIAVQIVLISACVGSQKKNEGPRKVEVRNTDGKYRLYVDGAEFYVNGAGCEFGDIQNLASHGANSFRTWRTENGRKSGKEVLDEAQANGLMVLMGLDVHRERHGFDYNDSVKVQEQFDSLKNEVLKYKDHPALLGWSIGNELNLSYSNPKVWDAVNDISKMIHEVDGNHPTTTALAGISKNVADEIEVRCPDLDFLSIQMYGDVINIIKRVQDADWNGPYLVTEWGATGHWEVGSTEWGIPIEETSTEKANAIKARWEKAIKANDTTCLGSYVFVWEQKQERTPTWYGLILESGEETEATDFMQYTWTGKWPENLTPVIDSVLLTGKTKWDNVKLDPSQKCILKSMPVIPIMIPLSWIMKFCPI